MKNFVLPLATLVFAAVSTAATAGDTSANPTHVVELFTSQGCSSCPPANEFVSKLAADPDMLVLSYGVTYWDFLGWKDTFGDPEFTKRQREYRDAFAAANIYTPQIVLAGSVHSPRYSKKEVSEMKLVESGIDLALTRDGNMILIKAKTPKNVIVDVVSYMPGEQSVKVKRGENGGRILKLMNVVTAIQTLKWDSHSGSVELPPSENMQYAVLIHDQKTAKILDAAVID